MQGRLMGMIAVWIVGSLAIRAGAAESIALGQEVKAAIPSPAATTFALRSKSGVSASG